MKINFGCGNDKINGYLNFDKEIDLNLVLPFKDGVADEIICFHTIEHLRDKDFTLNEFKRILKEDGIIKIKLPILCSTYRHNTIFHTENYFDSVKYFGMRVIGVKKGNSHFKGSPLGDLFVLIKTLFDMIRFNEYEYLIKKGKLK